MRLVEGELPPSARKILVFLAIKGLIEGQYKIAKRTKLSHSRVHDNLKLLQKWGLVKSKKIGQARTGLPMRSYTLTSMGLIQALDEEQPWQKIDEVARKQKEFFPLIFGKWDHFDKAGAKDLLISFFKKAIERRGAGAPWPFSEICYGIPGIPDDVRGLTELKITTETLWPPWLTSIDSGNKLKQKIIWIKALSSDPELAQNVEGILKDAEELHLDYSRFYNISRKAIKQKNLEPFKSYLLEMYKNFKKEVKKS